MSTESCPICTLVEAAHQRPRTAIIVAIVKTMAVFKTQNGDFRMCDRCQLELDMTVQIHNSQVSQ